jgi:hypothetical protein
MKNEVQQYVGKKAVVSLGGLKIEVKVLDVKNSYGRTRYQITPVSGEGQIWVETITLIK